MGLCTKCGKENPTPEKSMCPDCAARQSELRKQNREYRKKIGICTHCGKNPAEPNKNLCYECLGQFQDGYAAKGRTDEQREKDRRLFLYLQPYWIALPICNCFRLHFYWKLHITIIMLILSRKSNGTSFLTSH